MSAEPHGDQASVPRGPGLLRVLLVDDDPQVLAVLADAFTINACLVSTAETAEAALDQLADTPFDLVVSDIKLPGLSGLDVLRAVKGSQPGTAVVLITGMPSVNSAVFGLRHGAYDYLRKPFSLNEVQDLVQRVSRDRQQPHPARGPGAVAVTEDQVRRQLGVEGLFRISELALQRADPGLFVETVLDYTLQGFQCDAALIMLRDDDGSVTQSQRGDAALLTQLLNLLHAHFGRLVKSRGREALTLTETGDPVAGIAVLIPDMGSTKGVLCLGRPIHRGAFLPDEQDLLVRYGQVVALALQKVLFRESVETDVLNTIAFFITALESKDPSLKGHCERVSLYAAEIAGVLGVPPDGLAVIRRAGLLHDLGKLVLPDALVLKAERLTDDEYGALRRYPVLGARILRRLPFLAQEAEAVKAHLERFDGTGYPDRLQGHDIPLPARILAVADAFDAMTSPRPYRERRPLEAALEEVLRNASSQFDPAVTDALASISRARLVEIGQFEARVQS